jgi:glycosyltransferase involved in cell wall biosynthesis
MWNNKTLCVILPTYNEKDSICRCILDFENLGIVDRIIVVNNNAADGTSEEVAKTGAEEVFEEIQGYGASIQRGLREAREDVIVICEPDDTFLAQDIYKFLAYMDDADIVYGSRTVKHFIWTSANMGIFLRWGNWAVAKMMEVLYNTNSLTDVGCTYRLIKKEALSKILNDFRIKSNFFGPEMMLLSNWKGLKFIQIPINYKDRIGRSSVTGDLKKAFLLGVQMIWLILTFRFRGYKRA